MSSCRYLFTCHSQNLEADFLLVPSVHFGSLIFSEDMRSLFDAVYIIIVRGDVTQQHPPT